MKTSLFITFLAVCGIASAQTPDWKWARNSFTTGSPSHDEGRSVAVDSVGNVYVTGFYQSSNISFGTDTFVKVGGQDLFLVKYDANGNIVWAKSVIGSASEISRSVAVDPSGNIFITGQFISPTIIFGNDTLTNVGGDDVFVVKYGNAGNVLWAKRAGGPGGTCRGNSVTTDANGNAYVAGDFYAINFSIGTYVLTNTATGSDIFIAKYDPSGNVLWAKNPAGTGHDRGKSITTDGFGNIYLTGYSNSPTITFDSYTLSNPDVIVVKYDSAGNVLWAKSSQGTGANYGWGITTDVPGNCYVTGLFEYSDSITFGAFTLFNTNSSTRDVFIVKYDSAGNELWAESAGGIGNDAGFSIVIDVENNVYVAGSFSIQSTNSITFGSTTLPYPSGGLAPSFVAKYDSSGYFLCAFSLPDGGDDIQAITIDPLGNLYMGGDYGVDPFILGADTLTSTATEDVYVAKFTFKCGAVGVDEFDKKVRLSLHPNPTSGKFRVESLELEVGEVQVFDLLGNLVLATPKREIDLSGYPSGIYFIRVGEQTRKVILAR